MGLINQSSVTTRVLSGFDDPAFGAAAWERLLRASNSDNVYLTWEWQRAWWECFGEDGLLIILAERAGQPIALAPLFFDSGMIYFIGTGFESGYLDFIGDISDREVLDSILDCARQSVSDFREFKFHFLPDESPSVSFLKDAAGRLNLDCYDEEVNEGPVLELALKPDAAAAAIRKKDALYHERLMQRAGVLEIQHLSRGDEIWPHLDDFFRQHSLRWTAKIGGGRFDDLQQQKFIRRLTQLAGDCGWLRFVRIDLNGQPIAFQYGFNYCGRYTREISSFAIDQSRYAPGQVLLRRSFVAAIEEGAHTFDFGIGHQPYKSRFATRINKVRTWGLYQSQSKRRKESESYAAIA